MMTEVVAEPRAEILFVDDEQPILRSLKRLFRPTGHKVHIADSGSRALSLLEQHEIDVVVSDMRMPEMDGAEFLTQVASRWPETARMLLTGYADLSSAIEAINSGSISRYLTKPWQDDDIVLCIQQAVDNKQLLQEKQRLEALTADQNEELRALNEGLEEKVLSRTRAIEAAKKKIDEAHQALQAGFEATIEVFSRLVQARPGMASPARIAADCQAIADAFELNSEDQKTLRYAALLSDIGKLGLADEAMSLPYTDLSAPAQREFHRHPLVAEATLVSLDELAEAAEVIRLHCERLDGSGFPNKVEGDEIPLLARILGVVKAYAEIVAGRVFSERYTVSEAREYFVEKSGELFDADVVVHFLAWLDDRSRHAEERRERKLTVGALRDGMKVTRDLRDDSGVLILAEGHRISGRLIEKLVTIQDSLDSSLTIYVEDR